MPAEKNVIQVDEMRIDLRNRPLAALLAWLVPGAGHMYQRRYAKGGLFMVCILITWFLGFALGGGHVVYASWIPGDKRWHYILQAGVGAAALPALVQGNHMKKHTDFTGKVIRTRKSYEPLWWGFMAPPHRPVIEDRTDEVSAWYATSGAGYEMGTWYTMIAGLLNILVIYDAFSGPLAVPISGRRKDGEPDAEGDTNSDTESGSSGDAKNAGDVKNADVSKADSPSSEPATNLTQRLASAQQSKQPHERFTFHALDRTYLPALLPAADHHDLAGFWCDAPRRHQFDHPAYLANRSLDHKLHGDHLRRARVHQLAPLAKLNHASTYSRWWHGRQMGRRYALSKATRCNLDRYQS